MNSLNSLMANYTASEGACELAIERAEKAQESGRFEKATAYAILALVHHMRQEMWKRELNRKGQ